jgi:hypothetical protein
MPRPKNIPQIHKDTNKEYREESKNAMEHPSIT